MASKKQKLFKKGLLISCMIIVVVAIFFLKPFDMMNDIGMVDIPQSKKPNLIILLLDCVRADHLSCYGYFRETSPNIDALAAQGIIFHNAISQAPWTLPSVVSLLSGYYPSKHGAGLREKENMYIMHDLKNVQMPSKTIPLLQEILQQSSYQTWGYSTNIWINNQGIGNRGFNEFKYKNKAPATEVVTYGIDKIWQAKKNKKPFFLYLHFMDVHIPLYPPKEYYNLFPTSDGKKTSEIHETWNFHLYKDQHGPEFDNYREHRISLYDGTIRYMDAEIGRLFKELKRSGLMDKTIVIVLADHGEEFWDHAAFEEAHYNDPRNIKGVDHGHTLFQELIRVPLIVTNLCSRGRQSFLSRFLFKQKPINITETIRLIDLFPTLLERLDLPASSNYNGTSLSPLLKRALAESPVSNVSSSFRLIFSESVEYGNMKISLIEYPYKFIYAYQETNALFNLKEDPLERKNLVNEKTTLASEMLEKILHFSKEKPPETEEITLNKDDLEKLRALGYIK